MEHRSRMLAPSGFVPLVALTFVLAGCERGCLSTWFNEHGTGARRPGGPGGREAGAGLDLGGADCSSGLARCSAGHVEVSTGGHVPHPCAAPKELPGACACPWESAGSCVGSCVKDGLEVVAAREVAREQLCAPSEVALRPTTPAEAAVVTICAEDGVSCVDGIVRVCHGRGQPARLAGACVGGCAAGVSIDLDDLLTGDGAAAILCRRAHAERR